MIKKELIKLFKNYVKNYDMTDYSIKMKFEHSIRVMELCEFIAKKNNFSERDIELSILVGILHDYARFEQWNKYKTYSDLKSVDHGDWAVEKLFDNNEIKDYYLNEEYYSEIYDAIKYHNKIDYPDNIGEHNKLICKVIRDADKLDIFYLLGTDKNLMRQYDKPISAKIKDSFYKQELVNRKDVKSKSDSIIMVFSMVYDLNFKSSFEYIKEQKLIDKLYSTINEKENFKEYYEYINKYIEERIR